MFRTIHASGTWDSHPQRVSTPQFEIPMTGPFESYRHDGSANAVTKGMSLIGCVQYALGEVAFIYGYTYDILAMCQDVVSKNELVNYISARPVNPDFVIQDIKIMLSDRLSEFVTDPRKRDAGVLFVKGLLAKSNNVFKKNF
jgi:hypothetical protein